MDYKLLEINKEQGWALIEVTLPNGELYIKRMMVNLTNLDAMNQQIKDWYDQYLIDIGIKRVVDPEIISNINKTVVVIEEE